MQFVNAEKILGNACIFDLKFVEIIRTKRRNEAILASRMHKLFNEINV